MSVGLLVLLLAGNVYSLSLSCLNGKGKPVDYWAINKYPLSANYLYWDNVLNISVFQDVAVPLDDRSSPLIKTLQLLYDSAASIEYSMYNDHAPDGDSHAKAHSKGVFAFDKVSNTGYWITHSLPRYPDYVSKGNGNLSDLTYAQHFFCVSLDSSGYEKIKNQVDVNNPFIYDSNPPNSFEFSTVFNPSVAKPKPISSVVDITTIGGTRLTSLAKSKKFLLDLWDGLVAVNLGVDLAVQTWKNGGGENMPSSCTSGGFKNQVMNVQEVDAPSLTWKSTRDHSKWGVAVGTRTKTYVCFGDINRQKSQITRGGGAVCVQNTKLWNAMTAITGSYEACPAS